VQHSFAQNILAQIGYVGTKGTHLTGIYDINQAETSAAARNRWQDPAAVAAILQPVQRTSA
jgi:hypothetical protein